MRTALQHPDTPVGQAVRAWLRSLDPPPDADRPAIRPYDLVAKGPHKILLEDCVHHPVVEQAVVQAYAELKPILGKKLSGRQITAVVFESAPGRKDGNTSSRWNDIVKPILIRLGLELPTLDAEDEAVSEPREVPATPEITGQLAS